VELPFTSLWAAHARLLRLGGRGRGAGARGAAVEFDRFSTLTGGDPAPFRAYLSALADPEKTPDAVTSLREATFFGPTQAAALVAHLGETEAALALLEKAARSRSPYFLWANALPHFSDLRMEPRFQGILAWAGF
jgi:hypothetical protein